MGTLYITGTFYVFKPVIKIFVIDIVGEYKHPAPQLKNNFCNISLMLKLNNIPLKNLKAVFVFKARILPYGGVYFIVKNIVSAAFYPRAASVSVMR